MTCEVCCFDSADDVEDIHGHVFLLWGHETMSKPITLNQNDLVIIT